MNINEASIRKLSDGTLCRSHYNQVQFRTVKIPNPIEATEVLT